MLLIQLASAITQIVRWVDIRFWSHRYGLEAVRTDSLSLSRALKALTSSVSSLSHVNHCANSKVRVDFEKEVFDVEDYNVPLFAMYKWHRSATRT